jgi:acetyltransferase-like isoleucine patch superfamily enzyme/glycosyltransferase involved in cell wall biosynthesis
MKVGVIIPSFNQGPFLAPCLSSLIQQSYPHWEAVVVDDASTDGVSPDLAVQAAGLDSRIRLFQEETNRGRASVRHYALQKLTDCGAVLVLDADDLLAEDYLALLMGVLAEQEAVGMVYGSLLFFEGSGPPGRITRQWPEHPFDGTRQALEEHVPGPGALFRKAVLDRLDPWREIYNKTSAEDEDLALQVHSSGYKLLWVPEARYYYRQHAASFLAQGNTLLRAQAKLNLLRHHLVWVKETCGVDCYLERWILPPLRQKLRAGCWADAWQLGRVLLQVVPLSTVRCLAAYYGGRVSHLMKTIRNCCKVFRLLMREELVRFLQEVWVEQRLRRKLEESFPGVGWAPGVRVLGWPRGEMLVEPGVRLETGTHLCLGDEFNGFGRLEIGEGTWIGPYNNFRLGAEAVVKIGKGCLISQYCSIVGANHQVILNIPVSSLPVGGDKKGVIIGDDVWLGAGAVILPGVELGHGCVIGANAVVTHSVPPNEIHAGVPARCIGHRK